MKLFIKHMVSLRCKMLVQAELDKLGLHCLKMELGEVEVREDVKGSVRTQLSEALQQSGLELMNNKRLILIDRIKQVIVDMVHYSDDYPKTKNSEYIKSHLNHDYTYLANIFTEVTGNTIEQYIIRHKIERVKELLLYDELTLTEISYKLNYSSVSHLSSQFKRVAGLTPTHYKKSQQKNRTPLEEI